MVNAVTSAPSFELTAVPSPTSQNVMPPDEADETFAVDPNVHRRTLLKLDCLLLPFLALLFLFNSLDKSNVRNLTTYAASC
jgi:hypothetical protein